MVFHTYIADTQVSVDYSEEKDTITINSIHTFDGRPLVTSRTPELENAIIAQIRVARYEQLKQVESENPNGNPNSDSCGNIQSNEAKNVQA